MDDYRILKYEPCISKKFLFELRFNVDNEFFENCGIIRSQYKHGMYGLEDGDDDNALAHAAGIIKQIKINGSNEELRYKLMEDVSNYLECLECGNGNEECAKKMIEAALWASCFFEVYKMLSDYIKSDEDDFLLSIVDLLMQAGDYLLFVEDNPIFAMFYYELISTVYEEDEENIEIALKWKARYIIYRQIYFGYTEVDFSLFDNEFLNNCKNQYDSAMKYFNKYSYDAFKYTNNILDMMPGDINQITDNIRFTYSMILSIKRNCTMNILYLMSEYDMDIADEYEKDIKKAILDTNGNTYLLFRKWVEKHSEHQIVKDILRFVRVIYIVENIQNTLIVKNFPLKAAYYTSFNTLKYLLPETCDGGKDEECGKLSVMHLAYMNDPNEGMVLRKKVFGNKGIPQAKLERRELKSPYVFVKCFTSMIDYLPMWHMYGDSALGVCLVIEWDSENNDSLYNVCYLEKTSEGYKCSKKWNDRLGNKCTDINKALKELEDVATSLCDNEKELILDSLINPILYLFKDSSYSYEQEMRIMYQFQHRDKQIKHTNQMPPKLYVIHDKKLNIKEVIIGPKFENAVTLMPYLNEQLEEMAEKVGIEKPIVTLSNIEFR